MFYVVCVIYTIVIEMFLSLLCPYASCLYCSAAESAVREGGFGLGTEEIYLDEVVCNGNESSIDSGCSYRLIFI